MGQILRKVPWDKFVWTMVMGGVLYFYTLHLNAKIDERLEDYVTEKADSQWKESHREWGDEVIKRLDSKIDLLTEQGKETNQLVKELLSRRPPPPKL